MQRDHISTFEYIHRTQTNNSSYHSLNSASDWITFQLFEMIGVIVFSSSGKKKREKKNQLSTTRYEKKEMGRALGGVEELWSERRNRIPNIFLYLKTYSLKRVVVTADR